MVAKYLIKLYCAMPIWSKSYLNWAKSRDVRVFNIKVLLERFVNNLRVVDWGQRIDVLRLDGRDWVAVGIVLNVDVIVVAG